MPLAPDMPGTHALPPELLAVIVLLSLGVLAIIGSRRTGLSPIVGYLVLGVVLGGVGLDATSGLLKAKILSELGMVFLLFDIGLHFPLAEMRSRARDILGFGPVQVVFGTLALGACAMLLGLSCGTAILVGATLALSSTAVVAGLIAERGQQNCPVGRTATAILIFQDVAAIFLLIMAGSLGSDQALAPMMVWAVLKSIVAFGLAVLLARTVVRPLFAIVARTRNEEVFTAMALLIALVAGSATGAAGLSLTLGAFLGGMIISDSSYRVVIQSEIRPFRGLLVGFFFISVGLSLDLAVLRAAWPAVLGAALLLVGVKILTNAAASLVFGWSIPGSTQLGFLLAQGSEFAFVILSLPQVRALVGGDVTAVLIAGVAVSMALTPPLAMLGRVLAGRMRLHRPRAANPELQPVTGPGGVLIAGMGQVGRTLADALTAFGIEYAAVERDETRLQQAVADGYNVSFGDLTDPHLWEPLAASAPRMLVLTAPLFETSRDLAAAAAHSFPGATRVAVVRDEREAERFRSIGSQPVVVRADTPGFDVAASVLHELQIGADGFARWMQAHQKRSSAEMSN